MRWKGKHVARMFVGMGMFVPIQGILIPIAKVVKNVGLNDSRWSLILPYAAMNLAFATMVYYGFFKGIPIELEEAACMDGWSKHLSGVFPNYPPISTTSNYYISNLHFPYVLE